jgi:hypothetical protein
MYIKVDYRPLKTADARVKLHLIKYSVLNCQAYRAHSPLASLPPVHVEHSLRARQPEKDAERKHLGAFECRK